MLLPVYVLNVKVLVQILLLVEKVVIATKEFVLLILVIKFVLQVLIVVLVVVVKIINVFHVIH